MSSNLVLDFLACYMHAAKDDAKRLTVQDCVLHWEDMIASAVASGDRRWSGWTRDMSIEALARVYEQVIEDMR